MIVGNATVTMYADRCEDFEKLFRSTFPATAADDGVIEYRFHRSRENPCKYLIYEIYRDQAAVDAQLSETLGDISEAQLMAQQHYQQTAQRLQQDLADDLTAYEAALRDKDRQAALSAYESLMAAYDTYRRYRQQDMLELMTTLYEATLQQETAAAKASSSSGKSSSASKKTATPTTRKKQPAKKSSSGSYYDDSWLYMNHPSGM